uniref:bifunctional DNA primase/polymerase n=1 Tax=Sulfolobus neozealandicus TaxID=299422 RepID=UPI00159EDBAE|nr:bifunctional DNA primase/polymerase [Sulfolobus neozealandicus]
MYLKHGLSVIPIKYKDKKPALESWKEYQERQSTEEEIERWFSSGKYNVGIVCGKASNNLVVLDFDEKRGFDKWYEYIDANYPHIRDMILSTWLEDTHNGVHVYLRVKDAVIRSSKVGDKLDIKGDGGYVVATPSLHPEGTEYSFRLGPSDGAKIIEITKKQFDEILKTLREVGLIKSEDTKEERKERANAARVSGFRYLKEEDLSKVIGLAKEGYKEGYRNQLCMFLSGWLAVAGIHPLQAVKIIKALHDDGKDEEPLANRCKPIVYSYAKAGYDLTQFREEMEKECGGNLSGWNATGAISGVRGVQQILNATVGKDKALIIIRQLQEALGTASPYEDAVFEILDYSRDLYVVANPEEKVVVRAYSTDKEYKEKEVVIEAYPTAVEVYENPVGGITKYRTVWASKVRQKPIEVGPATADEIADYLRAEGVVKHKDLVYNTVSALLMGYIKYGKAVIKNEFESPGFYLNNGKIEPSRVEIRKPSREELREALELLDDLAERWFSHIKDKFAMVVKWGIISPFGYVYKQKGSWIKWLYLFGISKSGKTTLAEMIMKIWGINRAPKSGANIDNVARLGAVLMQGTYPDVINEPGDVLKENSPLIDPIKNAIEQKTARGAYRHGNYVELPSLAMLVFTSNRVYPKDSSLIRRFIIMNFDEQLSDDKIAEFDKNVRPLFNKLKALGDFVAYSVVNDNNLLQSDWEASAVKLLEMAYKEAGLAVPQWIYEKFSSEGDDVIEDNIQRIREFMLNVFMSTYIRDIAKTTPEDDPRLIVREVLQKGLIPWAQFRAVNGYNEIRFTIGLTDQLAKVIGDITLKQLARLLGWEHKDIRVKDDKGRWHTIKGVIVKEHDLYRFLFPQDADKE